MVREKKFFCQGQENVREFYSGPGKMQIWHFEEKSGKIEVVRLI